MARALVEVLAPCKAAVYDPGNGWGGMFAQGTKFTEAHAGKLGARPAGNADLVWLREAQ